MVMEVPTCPLCAAQMEHDVDCDDWACHECGLAGPRDVVERARLAHHTRWRDIEPGSTRRKPDSVTERRKNGKAYSVESDGRCVEVEDLPW